MGKKGTMSRTHKGRKNYTTKRGNKVYHQKGHNMSLGHMPFGYKKGSHSKSKPGLFDFTTKFGDLVFHQKGHNVKKSKKPFARSSSKTRKMR
jgi:hypothetical protein